MVAPTVHTTQKWLIFQNQAFSLVTMLTSISQSLYDFSKQEYYHTYPSHIYIYVMHLTLCGRIFKHTILRVQYNKKRNTETKEQACFRNCVTTNEFHTIPSEILTTYNSCIICSGIHLTCSKKNQ